MYLKIQSPLKLFSHFVKEKTRVSEKYHSLTNLSTEIIMNRNSDAHNTCTGTSPFRVIFKIVRFKNMMKQFF